MVLASADSEAFWPADIALSADYVGELRASFVAAHGDGGSRALAAIAEFLAADPFADASAAWSRALEPPASLYACEEEFGCPDSRAAPGAPRLDVSFAVLPSSTVASAEGWEAGPTAPLAFLAGGVPEAPALLESLVFEAESARAAAMGAYQRSPVFSAAPPEVSRVVAITYAENCCERSRTKNLASAIAAGAHDTRFFDRAALDPSFEAAFVHVLNVEMGAGVWAWKPQILLQTLEDPALPWGTGAAVYLDAGNYFHGSIGPLIAELRHSDVVAHANLWMSERKMARPDALRMVRGGTLPWVQNTPQLGTPLIAARKTPASLAFFREWRSVMREGLLIMHRNETTTPRHTRCRCGATQPQRPGRRVSPAGPDAARAGGIAWLRTPASKKGLGQTRVHQPAQISCCDVSKMY